MTVLDTLALGRKSAQLPKAESLPLARFLPLIFTNASIHHFGNLDIQLIGRHGWCHHWRCRSEPPITSSSANRRSRASHDVQRGLSRGCGYAKFSKPLSKFRGSVRWLHNLFIFLGPCRQSYANGKLFHTSPQASCRKDRLEVVIGHPRSSCSRHACRRAGVCRKEVH